jgi:hypothetical protein
MKFTAIFPILLLLTSAYAAPASTSGEGSTSPDKPPAKPPANPAELSTNTPCSTVDTCKKKGEDVWKTVLDAQKKEVDTPGLSKQYKDHYEPRTEKKSKGSDKLPDAAASEVHQISQLMNLPGLGVPIPKTMMKMVQIDIPAYEQFYSDGVIVGSFKFKEFDQVDKDHQLHWNAIAFICRRS